jgi:hypothetical protein
MAVNYEDPRFSQVEADKKEALTDLEQTYAGIIGNSDQYYQAQIDASKQWADTQSKLQQDNTDFAIEQIEQQKAQAQKDYTKEQSGAYVDWQKQSNEYGTEAEKIASAGMAGTGFSESSQVSMYNTYQNRVVTARESYNKAVMNYNNAIKDARLQNNAVLAEIAYQSLQQQLELSLQGFQYKNQLILEQANKKTELENTYYGRYMDVLNQINQENALAEEQRQFNQNYALSMQQMQEEIRQYNQSYSLQVKEYEEGIRQFNEEIARLKAKDKQEHQREIQQLELQKKQYELEKQQIAEQKELFACDAAVINDIYCPPGLCDINIFHLRQREEISRCDGCIIEGYNIDNRIKRIIACHDRIGKIILGIRSLDLGNLHIQLILDHAVALEYCVIENVTVLLFDIDLAADIGGGGKRLTQNAELIPAVILFGDISSQNGSFCLSLRLYICSRCIRRSGGRISSACCCIRAAEEQRHK